MMFTIKYRTWNPASEDNVAGAIPGSWVQNEQLWGPFEFVSAENRPLGLEVYGYYKRHPIGDDAEPNASLPMTFGPFCGTRHPDDTTPDTQPRPVLWVMNEHGATVAKYDL